MKLTTSRIRMRGAIFPLRQYSFMAWYLIKYSDNFTFTKSRSATSKLFRSRHSLRSFHTVRLNIPYRFEAGSLHNLTVSIANCAQIVQTSEKASQTLCIDFQS